MLAICQNFTLQYFPPIIRNTIIISGCNTRGETRSGRARRVTMSILKYFKGAKENIQNELPDPSRSLLREMPSSSIAAANTMVKSITAKPRKQYIQLTPVQRFQIGKKAAEIGIAAALRFFKKNHPDLALTEPTVRRAKNRYVEELKKRPRNSSFELSELQELPTRKRGRPLLIGEELDKSEFT